MNRQEFETLWSELTPVLSLTVNDSVQLLASAHFIDHCGGLEMWLKPQCLMWGRELAFIDSVANIHCLSVEFDFLDCLIIIR